jgi:hypothetical protein
MTDLKQDLQSIADRHAEQADGDFDSVLRTATTRGRRRIAVGLAAACAVLVVGGIATLAPWQDDSLPAPAPVATGPTLDPKYRGTMTITPATAKPGAQIGLRYPEGYERGLEFTLAEPASGKLLFYLAPATPARSPGGRPWEATLSAAPTSVPISPALTISSYRTPPWTARICSVPTTASRRPVPC